jgi:mRNA interferase HigB
MQGVRMVVINEDILKWFAYKHNQAKKPLKSWFKASQQANWRHLMDVRRNFPSADGRVKDVGYTVFNIMGNRYRLITLISYKEQVIEIIDVLTHAEYDKWNKL